MATRIYDRDANEVVELSLMADGQDFLFEIIGNSDADGSWVTEREDAEFEMDGRDLSWWHSWAEREQLINDVAQERGEDAIRALCEIDQDYPDMEEAQAMKWEYLGI